MDIVINLSPVIDFITLPPHLMVWRFFVLFGWLPVALTFLWGAREVWLTYIRKQWAKENAKYVLLAIDIPRGNEQTPKAIENFFAYLGGAHGTFNLIEKWWEGGFQLSFSFEIVSIEGYTQFLIHTPVKHRDLVESGIYAQYPDAEITEVEDYTVGLPTKFPDEEHDIYGAEFIQKNHWTYPIKTYKDFEHQMGAPETQYKDPMASLMDLCSSLRRGEQLWYQMIVIPIAFDWAEEGEKEISRLLGETVESEKNIFDKIGDTAMEWMGDFSEFVYKLWGDIEEKEKEEDDKFLMMNLKPKQKKQIEAITEKVSKLGFEFKIRMIYMAKKEVMNSPKVMGGFVGFMKHFFLHDLNNISPELKMTATRAFYLFRTSRLNRKKNRLMKNYINRDDWAGKTPGIFNVEELASLWHFPVESVVKAPLIQKAPGRKSEPPMSLPVSEERVSEEILEPIFEEEIFKGEKDAIAEIKKPKLEAIRDEEAEKDREAKKIFKEEIMVGETSQPEKKASPPGNLPVA